jgi:uncharacterized membrane protein YhaH (DUF805 family)
MTSDERGRPARHPLAWLLLSGGLALFTIQAWSAGVCLQDDAFISLRYARNLADGHGLVYNPGERVEGYTNFLWTVTSAIPFLAGFDPVGFLRGLGLVSGLAMVLTAFALTRAAAPRGPPLAAGAAALLTGSLPFLAVEAVMGLETCAFAALIALWLSRQLVEADAPQRFPVSGIVGAVSALVRPEAHLVAALLGVDDLLRGRWRHRRFWIRWGIYVAVVAVHVSWRIAYYASPLPNTFYAKVSAGAADQTHGLSYTAAYLAAIWPLWLLGGLAMLVALASRRLRPSMGTGGRWLLLALPGAYLAYATYVGGDFKPTYRFFALPSLLLAVLAGLAILGACEVIRDRRPWLAPVVATCATLIAGLLLATGTASTAARDFADWRAKRLKTHLAAGRHLAQTRPPGTWLATGNAGAVPFASRLPTIDILGLCDAHIARSEALEGSRIAGHAKGDADYVLGRAPDLVLFQEARFSSRPLTKAAVAERIATPAERQLWNHRQLHEDYRWTSERLPGFYFNYFERREARRGTGSP